jgi:hypothetical protein
MAETFPPVGGAGSVYHKVPYMTRTGALPADFDDDGLENHSVYQQKSDGIVLSVGHHTMFQVDRLGRVHTRHYVYPQIFQGAGLAAATGSIPIMVTEFGSEVHLQLPASGNLTSSGAGGTIDNVTSLATAQQLPDSILPVTDKTGLLMVHDATQGANLLGKWTLTGTGSGAGRGVLTIQPITGATNVAGNFTASVNVGWYSCMISYDKTI